MPISIGAAILGSAVIGAGSSIIGGVLGSNAENNQLQLEKQLYQQGLNTQAQYVSDAATALNPLIQSGQSSEALYNYLTAGTPLPSGQFAPNGLTAGSLTAPFTGASLPYTPGYQFTLGTGLQATQNSAASRGLGSSGNANAAAASFATGTAQNTYNSQFANYLAQNQQIANLLFQPVTTGAGAAETLGGIYGSAGNAALSGAIGTGTNTANTTNALAGTYTGATAGASNSLTQNLLLYSLLNQGQNAGAATTNAAVANIGTQNYVNDAMAGYLGNPLQTG